jgi:hypothetical protein
MTIGSGQRSALALIAPSSEELEYLEATEHEKLPTDWERAWKAAQAFVDDDAEAAASVVALLRHGTRRILASPLGAPPCLAMADALVEHTVIGIEATAELFDQYIPRNFGRELVAVATDQKEESRKPLRLKAAAHAVSSDPPPRIDPATPLSRLFICTRGVLKSDAGRCREGMIVADDDPLILAAPRRLNRCFGTSADAKNGGGSRLVAGAQSSLARCCRRCENVRLQRYGSWMA